MPAGTPAVIHRTADVPSVLRTDSGARVRVTYVTGSSNTCDDHREQWSSTQCDGTSIFKYAFHTITAGSAGTVEIDTIFTESGSLVYRIQGRSAPGSIHMRFEYSRLGNFSDTQLLLDGTVQYQALVFTEVCLILPSTAVGECQYGTRVKTGESAMKFITDNVVNTITAAMGASFLSALFVPFIGQAYDLQSICASLPVLPEPVSGKDLLFPGLRAIDQLKYMLWFQYCECVPGTPTPVPPTAHPPANDGTWPTSEPIILNPTNPCLSLDEVIRLLREIQRTTSNDLAIDTFVQRQLVPGGTTRGKLLTGLSGGGSFEISAAIGVQVVITQRIPGRELEGAPPYIWDAGWLSIMDDNGFIQERRLTRDVEVWLPRLMSDATTFGYFFKEGVVGNITVLHTVL